MTIINIYNIIKNVFFATLLPGVIISFWLVGLITLFSAQLLVFGFFFIFVVLPFIYKYSISWQRGLMFLTFVHYPRNTDLTIPHKLGLIGARNFYLKHYDKQEKRNITLGVWHLLPNYIIKHSKARFNIKETSSILKLNNTYDDYTLNKNVLNEMELLNNKNLSDDENKFFEETMRSIHLPIVLYLHGNTGSRGAQHRIDLYKVFSRLNYQVIAFDYRGYGDSENIPPTEIGCVNDAIAVYEYIVSITDNPVFLWGHSMGTGVATHMLANLINIDLVGPRGVILESPFNNLRDEINEHPFANLFRYLPWFEYTIIKPMYANEIRFESDIHVAEFHQPILILHAEDDLVVPFKLGYKLYRTALEKRKKSWGPTEFHRFESKKHYGHKYICKAANLPEILATFVNAYRNEIY